MITAEQAKLEELKGYIRTIADGAYPESNLISVLHKAQELFGYLTEEVMEEIAVALSVPTAKIWGVASFYHYFNLKPVGRHIISVCMGTACYVKGAGVLLQRIQERLNIGLGDTTKDSRFTLREARCLGACGLAPVVMIDERIYGKLSADDVDGLLDTYGKE
jgi:NADH:ubiquinone oxidoreductase subunit E